MKKLAITLLLLLVGLTVCRGQSPQEATPLRVSFLGPDGEVLSSIELDANASDRTARQTLDQLLADPALRLERIHIRSGASLEGAVDNNQLTSDRRAEFTRTRVLAWAPELADVPVEIESVGEDYATLRTLLAASSLEGADEAIRIIDTVPIWVRDDSGTIVSSRKKQIMDLRGGSLWHLMREELFPALRTSQVLFLFSNAADGDTRRSTADNAKRSPDGDTATILSREGRRITALTPPVTTYFPVGSAVIEPDYLTNPHALEQISSTLSGLQANPDRTLTAIHLTGAASPEGPEFLNRILSLQRANALRTHLNKLDPRLTPGLYQTQALGEDYGSLLDWLRRCQQPWADQALQLADGNAATRKSALRALDGGQPWRTMHQEYFPWLRRATVAFEYQTELLQQPAAPAAFAESTQISGLTERPAANAPAANATSAQKALWPVFGISTNLLYDFTYIPNYGFTSIPSVSLEYYPARSRHFTFGADVEWPMWQHWDTHRFLQIQHVTLWTRRYFRKQDNRFRGLYLLASVNGARFGLGWDAKGWEGEGLGGSVGVGCKWILGKSRFFLDLGLAAGAFFAKYDPYLYGYDATRRYYYDYLGDPDLFHERNHRLFWAGPTRIYFSIGFDLFNRKKR